MELKEIQPIGTLCLTQKKEKNFLVVANIPKKLPKTLNFLTNAQLLGWSWEGVMFTQQRKEHTKSKKNEDAQKRSPRQQGSLCNTLS